MNKITLIARLAGLDTRIKWIAIEDIGTVVARVFSDPETFISKKLAIAGDEKSIRDAKEVFKKVDGKAPFQFSMPPWLFRRLVNNDLVEMWLWFRHGVFDASVAETRKISPGLMDMEGWLRHKRVKVESRS
jgi:hypothetical protein